MCCIAEIAMSVFGIITLIKGQFRLSRNRVVTGLPAYAIGVILASTLPLLLGIGFVLGFALAFAAAARGQHPPDLETLIYTDLVFVPMIHAVVTLIAFTTAKPIEPAARQSDSPGPPPSLPPTDPDNPYASPFDDPGASNAFR